MKVEKKELPKSQLELTVELTVDELKPYVLKGADKISQELCQVEGFRPGKVPFEILKQKIGEMAILEEAANLAINKTLDAVIQEAGGEPVGQPEISIVKLAPENPFVYKAILSMLPEITLGDYKNSKVKMEKVEVKAEDVDKVLEDLREMRAKEVLSDSEIKEGDKVLANIEMFLDKVPVEGGQGKGVTIIIGKNFIVPGFDKQLLGAKKGDVKDFSLPYPKDHHMANLAGKMVEFRVTINDVYSRELPELNEEFAATFGLKKGDELKENIKKSLEEEKKKNLEQKSEIEMIDKILDGTKFSEIPEVLVNHEAEGMLHELQHDVEAQGGKFDDYLASIKKSREQITLDLLPNALKRVKSALLIRKVAVEEKIEVSDKEVEEKIEELAKQYQGYDKVQERIKQPSYKNYLKNILANGKVIEKLKEWNVEK